jgi:hypothetical protein
LKNTHFKLQLDDFDTQKRLFSKNKMAKLFIAVLFYVSDAYPRNTGTRLEALNSPKTGGAQKLTLENTSIRGNSQLTRKLQKIKR